MLGDQDGKEGIGGVNKRLIKVAMIPIISNPGQPST
jgi:hypothetical protein